MGATTSWRTNGLSGSIYGFLDLLIRPFFTSRVSNYRAYSRKVRVVIGGSHSGAADNLISQDA
jgi:hypothetical protein